MAFTFYCHMFVCVCECAECAEWNTRARLHCSCRDFRSEFINISNIYAKNKCTHTHTWMPIGTSACENVFSLSFSLSLFCHFRNEIMLWIVCNLCATIYRIACEPYDVQKRKKTKWAAQAKDSKWSSLCI